MAETMPRNRVQTFNDGICDVYSINDDDTISLLQAGLRFEDRTVGSTRFFAAKDYQHSADRMIRIPWTRDDLANSVIDLGGRQYAVIQAQKILDTFPRCLQLTIEGIKPGNEHTVYTPTPEPAPAPTEGGESDDL